MMQNLLLTPLPLETLEERFSSLIDQKFKVLFTTIQEKQNNQVQEYLNRKEAAKLLGVSLPTLHTWTLSGKLQGYRISSRVRYKRAELESALSKIKTK